MNECIEKVKITVLVSGGGTNLQSIIDNIKNGYLDKAEIVRVISSNCSAFALQRARDNGINGICIDKIQFPNEEQQYETIINALAEVNTDLIVLAGYMKILQPELINLYRDRIINIHPSLIPKFCGKGYYGHRVHDAVLSSGEKMSGATVHFVDEGVDTGRIILQEQVKVEEKDTVETLSARILAVEHEILPKAIKMFCDRKI